MITSAQCIRYFGMPIPDGLWLTLFDVPEDLEIGVIPKRIWCNKLMIEPLTKAFINLISRGYAESELKTWDGCFNIRQMKGSSNFSLHAWGLAIDVNAFENQYGVYGKMTDGMGECFTDAGFDWGRNWQKKDSMHFQLKNLP